jgi:hypothetical protein
MIEGAPLFALAINIRLHLKVSPGINTLALSIHNSSDKIKFIAMILLLQHN